MQTRDVIIGGDILPSNGNRSFFIRGDADSLLGDLLVEFETADLRIINLECPLIEAETPIRKSGPTLGAESACVNGLAAAKIDVVGLANNHILDHGAAGLENPLAVCSKAGISTVGAGKNR